MTQDFLSWKRRPCEARGMTVCRRVPEYSRFVEMPTIPTPGRDCPPPKAGIQLVTNRFVEMPTMPTPGHGSLPPKAGMQPVTDRFVETPTMSTPGHGNPPLRAGTQPVNDRFVETPRRAGKQPVTDRFTKYRPCQPRDLSGRLRERRHSWEPMFVTHRFEPGRRPVRL